MRIFVIICLFFLSLLFSPVSVAQTDINAHPRLLLKKGEEIAVLSSIQKDPIMLKIHDGILSYSESVLQERTVKRVKTGKRLLAVSRVALQRIFALCYSYRMTSDTRYAERAKDEILACCHFTDWNPSHFLDVGEMTMAVAIGYDWLFYFLNSEDKTIIENAIYQKGFLPSENKKYAWFYNRKNNWNQVCNAGLIYGALAVFESYPEYAQRIIEKGISSNRKSLDCYGPDGGYPEGFMYWSYGTSFQIMLIAAMESALGTDAGLTKAPGFLESSRFMQFMTAPTGDCFCFSDSSAKVKANIMMFWCATKLQDNSLLWLEKKYLEKIPENFYLDSEKWFECSRLLPVLPIFNMKLRPGKIKKPQEKSWSSKGANEIFIYREGWDNSEDAYLGIKGGTASNSHGHMDAGSFIYEKSGIRWSMDLGVQPYITLESKGVDLWNMNQDSQRWDVFRLSNEAHSTITLNGNRHCVDGFASIKETFTSRKKKGATVDLTTTLGSDIESAIRSIYLDQRNNLHIEDTIVNGKGTTEVLWILMTPAQVEIINNKKIMLSKDGKLMLMEILSPVIVLPKILDNNPKHNYDMENPDTRRISFTTTIEPYDSTKIIVKLTER